MPVGKAVAVPFTVGIVLSARVVSRAGFRECFAAPAFICSSAVHGAAGSIAPSFSKRYRSFFRKAFARHFVRGCSVPLLVAVRFGGFGRAAGGLCHIPSLFTGQKGWF